MVRIMLALLALLGIAAQAVPAQARVSGTGGAEVGSVEARPAAVRAVVLVRPVAPPVRADIAAPQVPVWPSFGASILAPAVRLRIDRSHE